MPGDSEHPVTVGDLRVWIEGEDFDPHMGGRPATVADLVSALRAEGVFVQSRAVIHATLSLIDAFASLEKAIEANGELADEEEEVRAWVRELRGQLALDALAEAQPFPPAGGVS